MERSLQSARRANPALWFGVALSVVGVVTYFTVFARFPAVRDFPWINLPLALAGCALSALALWRAYALPAVYRGKILAPIGLLLSLGVVGLFVFYVFFYSAGMPAQSATGVALTRMPNFSLVDQHDRPVQATDLRGRKVVLTFFRGHW